MLRPRSAPLMLALAFGLAPAVAAAEPTVAEIALARRLFTDARAAEEANDWKLATAKLRDALAIKETPGLRFHLAYCQEQLGMLVEALVDYDRADEALRAEPGSKPKGGGDVAKQVVSRREALRKRIPTIHVTLPEGVSSATLSLDGHPVSAAVFGRPIPENPGSHRLIVSAEGREPFTHDLTLSEGDAIVVTAVLPIAKGAPSLAAAPAGAEVEPAADRAAPQPAPRSNRARTWVLVSEGAVTAISLGVGVGFTIGASSADSRADRARNVLVDSSAYPSGACAAPTSMLAGPCGDLSDAVSAAKSRRGIATVGFVGAGVGAAAFAATWVLWPKSKAPSNALAVVPIATAHGDRALLVTGFF